ncbi:unnamed protein product [Parnassius apollo]|uniref:Beta-glucuronidase n=1 Tax=Parnassius apollo TaxID=110799 RepID=A0A8S3WXU0_PARAO|nr:unnamed protein product [Parnassius apollo]
MINMLKRKSRLVLIWTLFISLVNATVSGSSSANEINQTQKKRFPYTGGALYPQATETRDLRTLDGIWNFRKSPSDPEYGYRNGWYKQDLEKDANTFLNHKSLDVNKYKAFISAFTITRMGIVRGVPCDWDEKVIMENIDLPQNCGSILKVRRLNRKVYDGETPKFIPTETIVLTFDGKVLPPRIFICFNFLSVELYIYPTLQCFNCCRFGHTKMQCRGSPRCYNCGDNHSGISCETERDDAVCILCSGSHFATDKKCPEYARQKAIKETMARNSISYSEASKIHPPVSKSYADVIASASLAPSGRTITYSSPYNSTSPSKSHTQSYRKTVFSKPKARPRNTSKGYDQKAHAELIQDYSNIPSSSTGCLKNYKDLSEIITKDLIISIIQYLSQHNLIKIPSNDAASSKSFLTHGQSGPSTKPVSGPVIKMPVPSSYNDVGEDASLRDHVGLVWYDRRFHVPPWWLQNRQRVWLRFSSVHYAAHVWVNGKLIAYHEIGHLPFEVEITDAVYPKASNLLTVVVDNTLLNDTIPQGIITDTITDDGKVRQERAYNFDFFNYAGIHRTVFLYSTPQQYIDDVIVNTDIQGLTGFVVYNVTHQGSSLDNVECLVQIFDKNDSQVAASHDCAGLIEIGNANFWWPYLMHPSPGYLYTFKASLTGPNGEIIDTYNLKVGIRTVTWSNTSVYINDKPIYLRGFGMHEDSDFRGKGWDPVLWVKNFNLIRWVGANVFRTSHYPYAEEIYQLADEQGIMIIDECPGVSTEIFSKSLLAKHKQSLTELIRRDKNHPSVVMWSIANEPKSADSLADAYFGEIVEHVKSMDLSRPITIAISETYTDDQSAKHLDVISFNRYNGWYLETGSLTSITNNVVDEATAWHIKYNKPIIMSEYGADTIAGLHLIPEYVWSEEFQVALMSEHFKAFDKLRQAGFFVGEFIWNFADFNTAQMIIRVGGNKKGIFTRSRQPKASAHHLRARYLAVAASDAGTAPPDSLYISDYKSAHHEEL